MVVRVNQAVIAFCSPQQFDGPVRDHLIGVHVGGSAGAALDRVDDKLVVKLSPDDFIAGGDDGGGQVLFQMAVVPVNDGGGLFYLGQADDQLGMHGSSGDGEIHLSP